MMTLWKIRMDIVSDANWDEVVVQLDYDRDYPWYFMYRLTNNRGTLRALHQAHFTTVLF